jgi:protein-S-isoprenylcysteine O-methyltransferase Ste14
MTLTARNIVVNALYYGATVVGIPSALLLTENLMGIHVQGPAWLRTLAAILLLAGVALQLRCITLFQRRGGGTPSPLWPPGRLVLEGPYRWVRNPMNVGELAVFLALGAWFGSPALVMYTVLAWLAFHLFIVLYEEPRLAHRFGIPYDSYRHSVGRWVPAGVPRASLLPANRRANQEESTR